MVRKIILLGSIVLFICVSSIEAGETITKRLYIPVAKNIMLQKSSGGESLMIKDYLNSTREVIDGGGALTIKNNYLPYGNMLDPARVLRDDVKGNDKLFTSHRKLENLSVYHAGARFYSPTLGQFIQADTVEGTNRYAYARSNPISFVDPTGHQADQSDYDERYACNEMDWGCRATAATTFGKLNGAIAYTKARGWTMTSHALSHFLYGNGEPLDISEMYTQAVAEAMEGSGSRQSKVSDYLFKSLKYNVLGNLDGTSDTAKFNVSRRDIISAICSNTTLKFSAKIVLETGGGDSDDIANSMNRYTINVSGDLVGLDRGRSGEVWNLDLRNPKINVYDKYDWAKNNGAESGFVLGQFLSDKMKMRLQNFGHTVGYDFLDIGPQVIDRDVATLMDQKIGMAKPFEMFGSIDIGDTFRISLDNRLIPR